MLIFICKNNAKRSGTLAGFFKNTKHILEVLAGIAEYEMSMLHKCILIFSQFIINFSIGLTVSNQRNVYWFAFLSLGRSTLTARLLNVRIKNCTRKGGIFFSFSFSTGSFQFCSFLTVFARQSAAQRASLPTLKLKKTGK